MLPVLLPPQRQRHQFSPIFNRFRQQLRAARLLPWNMGIATSAWFTTLPFHSRISFKYRRRFNADRQTELTIDEEFHIFFFLRFYRRHKRVAEVTNELQTTFHTSAVRRSLLINGRSIVTHRKRAHRAAATLTALPCNFPKISEILPVPPGLLIATKRRKLSQWSDITFQKFISFQGRLMKWN